MDRIWHDNVFFAIAFGQCLDEFVLKAVLVQKFMRLQADVKFYAGIAKGMEADSWCERIAGINLLHHLTGNGQGNGLNLIEITVIAYADGNADSYFFLRHIIVGQNRRGDFLVWDDDIIICG